LEDFYFAFRAPVSKAGFDSQAAPVEAKLKRIQGTIPQNLRAYELIEAALNTINGYRSTLHAKEYLRNFRQMDKATNSLIGDFPEADRQREKSQERDDSELATETNVFREKLQTSITLLREQAAIIREGQ